MAALTLALLGAVALMVAAVLLLTRGDDVAPVLIVAPEQPTPIVADDTIRVHVSGAVVSPGVFAMSEDDRVLDVIAAAGGLLADADLAAINLAKRVEDEAHYHVPLLGEASTSSPLSTSGSPASPKENPQNDRRQSNPSSSLVDLNTASLEELQMLPSIGPVMGERIIEHRNANGPFATVDEVLDVHGIGPKTLEAIRALVTVSSRP